MNQYKLLISVYCKAIDAECALDDLMEAVKEYTAATHEDKLNCITSEEHEHSN